ncbi:MAG: GGDEF domain-containing protein [Gemmatimonadaceae bacterium]|nr:GGDEF domain-containing protein [Gemmatimonadaceae bacterium]
MSTHSIGSRATTTPTPEQSNAEVLLWQSQIRLGLAVLLGSVGGALALSGVVPTVPAMGTITVLGYALTTLVVSLMVRYTREAGRAAIALMVLADVALVFGTTYLVVPPVYYGRALLFGLAIVHFAEFYFGRAPAWGALTAIVAGYLAMIVTAEAQGAAVSWLQELWSLAVFIVAGGALIVHYGNYKQRLARIVTLFERAEEGDFTGEYDVRADLYPDGITTVGRAYNRVRLHVANLVLTDALSGCHNRRGFEQHLTRELSRAARNGSELALVALDIDYFKTINDTFGHLAGDAVVQEIGELLREVARAGDVVARTGGDEFMLLLPETNAAGAFRVAKRILERVASHPFQGVAGKVPITVSIGLVVDRIRDENVMHDLHARADEALYAAKDAGRNRVSIWSSNLRAIAVTRAGQQLLRLG